MQRSDQLEQPYRLCAVIPTYNNPITIKSIVAQVGSHIRDILVVDDGSNDQAATLILSDIEMHNMARVIRRSSNGGKGAAVKTGLRQAEQLGFTHVLQIDADGQHDTHDIPKFVQASQQDPSALILGTPIFDASVPRARKFGRRFTNFWVHVETRGRYIADALFGYRIYPIHTTLAANASGNHMDFDPEIAVRMVWNGVHVINIPTKVRYLKRSEGGVSHFRPLYDNWLMTWLHTRLTLLSFFHRS